jgi:type IV secretory pathway VirB10-like protein
VTDAPHEGAAGPPDGDRPPQEMRLRSGRAPVTRLSRKVLIGLGAAAALGIGGALFLALRPQHQTTGSELYNTSNRMTPDGLANLPRDYTGLPKTVPQLGPPLPGDLGKPIESSNALLRSRRQRVPAISSRRQTSDRSRPRPPRHRPAGRRSCPPPAQPI